VLLQGYIICSPLQKRDISVLYVAKIKEKKERQNTKMSQPRWYENFLAADDIKRRGNLTRVATRA